MHLGDRTGGCAAADGAKGAGRGADAELPVRESEAVEAGELLQIEPTQYEMEVTYVRLNELIKSAVVAAEE